jgi:hypothetical protein
MTIYHTHHIIPRHAGGTDHPNNLLSLTIEDHAEAHRILYETYGRWQDEIAWKSLSKQITCAEATKIAQSLSNKGKNNPMYGMTGDKNPNYKNRGERSPLFGKKHSPETCKKKKDALIGRSYNDLHGIEKAIEIRNKLRSPKTEEHKKKLSKPKAKVVSRLKDRKEMSLGNYMNWLRMEENNGKRNK